MEYPATTFNANSSLTIRAPQHCLHHFVVCNMLQASLLTRSFFFIWWDSFQAMSFKKSQHIFCHWNDGLALSFQFHSHVQ